MIFYIFALVVLSPFIILTLQFITGKIKYDKTEYAAQTKGSFASVRFDKGKYGEYLTYDKLRSLDGHKKFLFNCYIPKGNNETTEIDLIMIHSTGIYVFESKNYSGWIFGNESQKNWTQTLPNGNKVRKERFFNPIIQNKGHIKWLKNFLSNEVDTLYHSIIVFSERCTLKKIELQTDACKVIKRENVVSTIKTIIEKTNIVLSDAQIDSIFKKLFPLTQKTEVEKMQHIENIKNNYNIL
ncbi:nuclease-related domain-containing protein [Eubacterium callanderi]|uniref:nuclease-related domain-containing protein n=1 Tax=Eubacterium callanderi TaxID=53442 RepID=UPI00391AA0C1